MGLKSALDQAWYVTLPVLVFLGWIVLQMFAVYDWISVSEAFSAGARGTFVGPSVASGVAGLLVMGAVGLLFVLLYTELGETTPGPSAWPPEE